MSSLLSAGATTLYKALSGAPTLVQLQDPYGVTLVQFDATLNESYGSESKPSEFPVEDGSTIADTMIRAPLSISLTGMKSDNPFDATLVAQEAATVAATLTLPPLGIIAAAAAYATWQAQAGSESPSLAAYAQLIKMQLGDPTSAPPKPPEPFQMVSRLGVFENMMITSLSVPRDASTGSALIFQLSMTRVDVVVPQSINISVLDVPALAAAKATAGEQQGDPALLNQFKAGDKAATGLIQAGKKFLGG